MPEIIPAVLPKSLRDLEEKMASVKGLVPLIQIDVCDGRLTPEPSWPYTHAGEDPDFVSIKKEESEFPFWEELDFEVDLMIKNPEHIWFDWIIAGAKRLIFHFESSENIPTLIQEVRSKLVSKESVLYVEIGLAINIDTPNEKIYPLLESVDFVQFMGIDKIGFQGQSFQPKVLDKIKTLKGFHYNTVVSVDGGVDLESAPKLVQAGVERLVSGSAIFESKNIRETILKFQNLG